MSWNTPSAFGQAELFRGQHSFQPYTVLFPVIRPDPIKPVASPNKDLEEAHYQLNVILMRLRSRDEIKGQEFTELLSDLEDIENLIYRNFK